MKSELEDFISNNREAFDTRMPDPAVLQRIQEAMNAKKEALPAIEPKKEKALVIPMRMVKWAAACLILVIGGAIFWMNQKITSTGQPAVTAQVETKDAQPKTVAPSAKEQAPLVADEVKNPVAQTASARNSSSAIDAENTAHKTVLFAKLNNMESPSQRVAAAEQVYKMKNTDTDIVDALSNTLNSDPSTNVRLAALDALSKFYREPYVKKKLLSSLQKQKDPMVQIQLIELLTKMKERSILNELDKIVNDGNTMQAVKDQAYSSIFTLRS